MTAGLSIKADYDKGVISIKSERIDGEIPLKDFCKLTLRHLESGRTMTSLCQEYLRNQALKNVK